jgi:hypothetical protein
MIRKTVEQYTQAEARDFFARLAVYSAEVIRVTMRPIQKFWPSKNHYEEWKDGGPIGHVLHYTAGTKFSGTIRHFVLEHVASSNWVVSRGLDPAFSELRRKLELDRDLRAETVQVVHPDHPSWHAGWVNRFLAGTEVRNAGILRPWPRKRGAPPALTHGIGMEAFRACADSDPNDLDFYWWPEGWTAKFTGEVTNVRGTWWETWSRGSVATVIVLLRYLSAMYPGMLRPEWMMCHHNLNPQKSDCVYLPNVGAIREAVLYDRTHVDDLEWLADLDDVDESFEDADEPWMMRELSHRQGDRAEEDLDGFDPNHDQGCAVSEEVKEGFRRLGFYVETAEALRSSVRTFQRGRELEVDGITGPVTRAALEKELKKWRLM